MRIENNSPKTFGTVEIRNHITMRNVLKNQGYRFKIGLTQERLSVLYVSSPESSIEKRIAKVYDGIVISDKEARQNIKNQRMHSLKRVFRMIFDRKRLRAEEVKEHMEMISGLHKTFNSLETSAAKAEQADRPWNALEVINGKEVPKYGPRAKLN